MSLFEALGLKKPKAVGAKPSDKPDAQQMAMLADATRYAPVLAQAQAVLAAWIDPLAATEKARIETTIVGVARASAKAGDYKEAMRLLGQVAGEVVAARSALALKAADQKALADAKKELDALVKKAAGFVPGITEPKLHKKLDGDLKLLKADLDAAGKLADPKAAATAVLALKPRAEKLKSDALTARNESAWIMANYATDVKNIQSWISSVKSEDGKAALQAVLDDLEAQKNAYLDAGDAGSVKKVAHPILLRIYHAAKNTADRDVAQTTELYRVHNLIDKIGALATKAVKDEIDDLEALKQAGLPSGATIDELEASLKDFADRLAKLRQDVQALRVSDAANNSDAKKAALEKTLGLYKDAVDEVGDKNLKTKGEGTLAALKKELAIAVAIKDLPKRGKAIVALDVKIHDALKAMKTHALNAQIKKSGTKGIDDQIAAMGASTDSDDDLTLCEAALQARFGIKVSVAKDLKKKSLPQLYGVMTKVPAWQAKNSKFKKLEIDNTRAGGVAFYQDGAVPLIALHDVPEDAVAKKVPDVNPATGTVEASYFDFTTLHEVGHAVDAKINFMGQRMGNAAFGGWQEPNTVDVVAEHFGTKGGFYARHSGGGKKASKADLKALLIKYLNERDSDKPTDPGKPLGTLIDDWDDIVDDPVIQVCELGMNVADEAWEGGASKAAQLQVDGRCFHNSYGGNTWVSYDYASRAPTGVSTYQWRAPGEWFAEIYALYYLGKLRESHPLTKWFKESAVSEKAARKPEAKAKPAAKAKG